MFRHPLFATLRLRIRTTWFVAAVVAAGAVQASALNIVITDDDGFETNNIQTLFAALKSAGHDVILSAPYANQSGASAHAAFVTPIKPTTSASAKGKLPAGSPGTGPTTIAADQYYVDGSPVMAVDRAARPGRGEARSVRRGMNSSQIWFAKTARTRRQSQVSGGRGDVVRRGFSLRRARLSPSPSIRFTGAVPGRPNRRCTLDV